MNQTVFKPTRAPCRSSSGEICKHKRQGCHSICTEYKIFRAQMDKFNEEQYRLRELDAAVKSQLMRTKHEK